MDDRFILRRATMSDSDPLSQLCEKTLRETFIEDFAIPYPKKGFDTYLCSYASPEGFVTKLNDPRHAIWIIEDQTNGEFVAYALIGPCDIHTIPHPDVCSNEDGLIDALFIRRDYRSYGLGQQLMKVILSWFEEHYPRRPLWLTVWTGNIKAQRFYTHYDFRQVGEYDYHIGEWKDHDFIMKREANTF